MLRFTQDQFVVLACLADYDFTAYEILSFASEIGYEIALETLFPTLNELVNYGLIQQRKSYGTITIEPMPIYLQTFELTTYGAELLKEEMNRVDLLIKRIRKQVRQLQ